LSLEVTARGIPFEFAALHRRGGARYNRPGLRVGVVAGTSPREQSQVRAGPQPSYFKGLR